MKHEHKRVMVARNHISNSLNIPSSPLLVNAIDAALIELGRDGWRLVQVVERNRGLWAFLYLTRPEGDDGNGCEECYEGRASSDLTAFQAGWDKGYEEGRKDGYAQGKEDGEKIGS